ncbi:hypothetical protein GN956_G6856 [Arapaima gigas]
MRSGMLLKESQSARSLRTYLLGAPRHSKTTQTQRNTCTSQLHLGREDHRKVLTKASCKPNHPSQASSSSSCLPCLTLLNTSACAFSTVPSYWTSIMINAQLTVPTVLGQGNDHAAPATAMYSHTI